jgi:hypothetical protein
VSTGSELAAVTRAHPAWECWRGVSGLYFARRRGTQDSPVRGESPVDLADMIARAEALTEGTDCTGPAPPGPRPRTG